MLPAPTRKRPAISAIRHAKIQTLSQSPTAPAVPGLEIPAQRDNTFLIPDRGHALLKSMFFFKIKTELDVPGIFVCTDHALLEREAVGLGSPVDLVDLKFFFRKHLGVAET